MYLQITVSVFHLCYICSQMLKVFVVVFKLCLMEFSDTSSKVEQYFFKWVLFLLYRLAIPITDCMTT